MSHFDSSEVQKLPYPKRVWLIIGNEFCERFYFFGMRAILTLYLKNKLGYTEDAATILYHGFTMGTYIASILGGIVSDVWFGKFKTIFFFSIVYVIGSTVTSASAIPTINFSPVVVLIIGLGLIALGSGGIKPCVASFGGDQFKLPEQAVQLTIFFSWFYFAISLGSLTSTTFTPILRADVHCFGSSDCYPLAFGVPAVLMVTATVLFLIVKSSYTYVKLQSENMLVEVFKCVTNAISTKFREGHKNQKNNLLDYSIEKYGEELVSEIRILMRLLVLYIPFPLFWALYEQKGSRWTFQANRMNGDIGIYTIKPDQMQMLNPLLVLIWIPTFENIVYPILSKIGIRRPLQKMIIGTVCAAISFLIAAIVQMKIDESPPKSVGILWMVPQYIAMSIGEVMFSVTGLGFSYEQSPQRMKSHVMTIWVLGVAFGSLILLIITELTSFDSKTNEFLLYSGLMFVDVFIFIALARRYKDVKESQCEEETEINTL